MTFELGCGRFSVRIVAFDCVTCTNIIIQVNKLSEARRQDSVVNMKSTLQIQSLGDIDLWVTINNVVS